VSGARIIGVSVTASVLILGVGGSAFPSAQKPRLPVTASPPAQPHTSQLLMNDEPAPPASRKAVPPRTGGGPASGTQGSSGTKTQEQLADQARDTYAPRPPSTPGVDQGTVDEIRDDAEEDVPVMEGVNGSPNGTGE
jgi:hypothetical protein